MYGNGAGICIAIIIMTAARQIIQKVLIKAGIVWFAAAAGATIQTVAEAISVILNIQTAVSTASDFELFVLLISSSRA